MLVIKSFKYKLKLKPAQEKTFERWLGVCRMVYNLAKEVSEEYYRKHGALISAYDLRNQLTDAKKEFDYLRELPKDTLAEPIFRFVEARQKFLKEGSGFPKWAKKDKYNTLIFVQQKKVIRIDDSRINLHKIGWIRFFNSRSFEGKIKRVSVSKRYDDRAAGRWYVSVIAEVDQKCLPKTDKYIGIDLGIIHLAATSNGDLHDNPRILKKHLQKLRIAQRSLARKEKDSTNWRKQKRKLNKLHTKIKNTRADYLHKLSLQLVRENQGISMEDLPIKRMVRNGFLAQPIMDVSWRMLTDFIEYKSQWYGRDFNKVSPLNTTNTCSHCKTQYPEFSLNVRKWKCENCGAMHHRDINAAKNIQRVGQSLFSIT